MNKTINQLPNWDFEVQNDKSIKDNFHLIQHDLNALNVKWRLMTKWVDRDILDRIIPEYEKRVQNLIYPLIID